MWGTEQRFADMSPAKQVSIVETAIERATKKQQQQQHTHTALTDVDEGGGARRRQAQATASAIAGGENTDIVSGEELVGKCERLLQALAKVKASGNVGDYPQELVDSQLRGLYKPQANLAHQLMQLALPKLEHTDLVSLSNGGKLPADVRVKLVDIATVKSRQMREELEGALVLANRGALPEVVSTHAHAPVIDLKDDAGKEQEIDAIHLRERPANLVPCKGLTDLLTKAEAPKKADRKAAKDAIKSKVELVAASLNAAGWAVCDQFAPAELVTEIRRELAHVSAHYEASEIWVGKEAGLGAQIAVPDVRGDKVMWMCGGHASSGPSTMYESAGEQPRTRGALEPCDRKVKNKLTSAGGASRVSTSVMSKFASIRQLIKHVDQLVFDQLKGRVGKLTRVIERSDAMLAVYPGKGTRFQRHVDNTAGDGRVLTVLVYLNTDWEEDNGGALRVFPSAERGPCDGSDASQAVVDVFPECGRLAMFFADEVPHEVRPTRAMRHAVTVWYYDEKLRSEAVSAASDNASSSGVAPSTPFGVDAVAKQEASIFVRTVLLAPAAKGDHPSMPARPTRADVEAVGLAVTKLSPGALRVMAGIVGASSEHEFVDGINSLTPDSLMDLRKQLRHMGV
jgi:hypothetical protein